MTVLFTTLVNGLNLVPKPAVRRIPFIFAYSTTRLRLFLALDTLVAYPAVIHKIILNQLNLLSKKALFLDRDGIINKNPPEHDYIKDWKEFKFNKGIFKVLRTASDKKYQIIVVTNQRGIAKGLLTDSGFQSITKKMSLYLKNLGLCVNAVYYCPHEISDNCTCRKPKSGLILEAIKDFKINPRTSIMVGDAESDRKSAFVVGIGRIVIVKKDLKENDIVDKIFMS